MISTIIKYIGLTIIVAVCAVAVFISIAGRDLQDQSTLKKIANLTSLFEDRFFDQRSKLSLGEVVDKNYKDERLVLLAIDDPSIKFVGKWPFPREVWTQSINKLKELGAKTIAFDVFFSEPALSCPGESQDDDFAKSLMSFQEIEGNRIILPYALPASADDIMEEIPDQMYNFIMDTQQAQGVNLRETRIGKKVFPLTKFADTEVGLAAITSDSDPDGVFRHYPLLINVEEFYFPGFALMAYQLYSGEDFKTFIQSPDDAYIELRNGKVQVNYQGETKIRWIGGKDRFPYLSIKDLLSVDKDKDEFEYNRVKKMVDGKLIFVGSTAFGAHDFRNTPVDTMLPGVYYHMNMTNMLLEGRLKKPFDESTKISWIMLAGGSLLIIFVMIFGNPILDLFTVVVIASGLFLFDTYLLVPQGYETKLFFSLLSVILCYSWNTFLNFYLTNREKSKIRGTFSSFVSPAVVDQMLDNPDMVKVGGEKKNITVFFSDVRDFTSISEKLTPEELSHALNIYMGAMTDIIFENQGTLDKYIGDAIVAFWGAPLDLDNHSYHALKAAKKMIEKLPEVNKQFEEEGLPLFKHGIGLNTGDCSVGNMGSDSIFQYTALGDNMNLGARLEALCKFYGVQLNVSEHTIHAIPEDLRREFQYRLLDKVRVKGKEEPVTMYEVFHDTHDFYDNVEAMARYNVGLEFYFSQQFTKGVSIFKELHEKYPEDKSSRRFMEMCEDFVKTPPPPGWDGVFTHTTKG